MSVDSTSPSSFLGGSWTQITTGFLAPVGMKYYDFDSTKSTILEKHQAPLIQKTMAANTTGGYAINGFKSENYMWNGVRSGNDQDANVNNNELTCFYSNGDTDTTQYGTTVLFNPYNSAKSKRINNALVGVTWNCDLTPIASRAEMSNMPPYTAVYIWKRTSL